MSTLKLRVLGSAAGGGFPQWNCNCANCLGLRQSRLHALPRSQSSVAISDGSGRWVLVNASPDIRSQLLAAPDLGPGEALRGSAIDAIVLIDSQIDHVTGLLMLREASTPLVIYCTDRVREDLESGFPLFRILKHYCGVELRSIPIDGSRFVVDTMPDLDWTGVPLTSKPPPYSPHRAQPARGDNLGLLVSHRGSGRTLLYAPGLGLIEPAVDSAARVAHTLLVDGTCWWDDEMSRRGVGNKLASQMGHLCQSGEHGMLSWLAGFADKRRILIHINNTNPILDASGPERATLVAQGIEVAEDGMVVEA